MILKNYSSGKNVAKDAARAGKRANGRVGRARRQASHTLRVENWNRIAQRLDFAAEIALHKIFFVLSPSVWTNPRTKKNLLCHYATFFFFFFFNGYVAYNYVNVLT